MSLKKLERDVIACTRCPRLIRYCRQVTQEKMRQFQEEEYWAKPVPGFGDARAKVLIVGLAPAAHGANRTGRMFTGDGKDGMGAADFLARSLHRTGFANRPESRRRGDGYRLTGAYLTAIVRCAPPKNKPSRDEIAACADYLSREIDLLSQLRVVVALGALAFDQLLRIFAERGAEIARPRPRFAHGARLKLGDGLPILIASYHPSRQNTQTGKLSPRMLDAIFRRAKRLAD